MSDAKEFAHNALIILLVIAIYNTILKSFLPTQVQTWVGL